jgi:hypothetical protein
MYKSKEVGGNNATQSNLLPFTNIQKAFLDLTDGPAECIFLALSKTS